MTASGTALVWFRRDLRLNDNPALRHGLDNHERVIPVFIYAPEEEAPWAPGGAQRVWLHASLEALRKTLRERGSDLVLRRNDDSLAELRDVARKSGAKAVYWNRLYEPAVIQRDRRIKRALREDGYRAHSFNGALLHEPWSVQTTQRSPYKVFTPYWRAIRDLDVDDSLPEPRKLTPLPPGIDRLKPDDLRLRPTRDWDKGILAAWTPGEAGAQKRLKTLCDDLLADYADKREIPSLDNTSRLSPHLHHGEIGPRQVWIAVNRAAAGSTCNQAAPFLREIGWREFAHHVLYHFPETPREPMDARFKNFPWTDDYQHALRQWQNGRTGIPLVDAGMRELWQTGWMHNRARMVVASFLTKNLRIPWQEGAAWFWDTLVDADLANNTMGWQWAAGSGADAAPYFRIFNPVRQGERFDPNGNYVRQWITELSDWNSKKPHAPWEAGDGEAPPEHYPPPLVDLKASRTCALKAFEKIKGASS